MTIISTWLDAVVDQLELQDLDARQLTDGLWGTGFERLVPTRQIGLIFARRLWQRAASLSKDPLLGLKVGLGLPLQAMNAAGLILIHSASLREAVLHMERYQQLVSNSGRLSVHRVHGGLEMRYTVTPCHVDMHHMQIDSLFGAILAFMRRCSRRDTAPEFVELTASDTRLAASYSAALGTTVKLGAPAARVFFLDKALDQPFQGADRSLLTLVQAQADNLLRAQNSAHSLEAVVRAVLHSNGFKGVSCTDVAQSLGLSSRTLQRRLSEAGMPFRRLLETARMDEAFYLLACEDLPLPAIAERLGYMEPSSFWHAVKACWGATPLEIRSHAAVSGRPRGTSASHAPRPRD